jgi:hypothetical protein
MTAFLSRQLEIAWRWVAGASVALAILAASGCGPDPAAQIDGSAKAKATNAVAVAKPAAGGESLTNLVSSPEFVDDPKMGKDPFFPNSTRREPRLAVPNVTGAPAVSAAQAVFGQLSLKAIVGPASRRLATINRTTMEAGEEVDVRHAGGKIRVKCLEVRPSSVLIEINGERRELTFRGGSQ